MSKTNHIPGDNESIKYPVSVKGVMISGGKILLLKNERDEWELPGGKLEMGEFPMDCLRREVKEETNIDVQAIRALPSYIYMVGSIVPVLIVPFLCQLQDLSSCKISLEHKEIGIFPLNDLASLNLSDGYRKTIRAGIEELNGRSLNDYSNNIWNI